VNDDSSALTFDVFLAAANLQNERLFVTATLHHHEPMSLAFFRIGLILSLLAVIPIFDSKQ